MMANANNPERFSYLYGRNPSVDRFNRPCPKKQTVLYTQTEADDETQESSSETSSLQEPEEYESHNVIVPPSTNTKPSTGVYLRLRTTNQSHYEIDDNILIEKNVKLTHSKKERHFRFTKIFSTNESQATIYNECVSDAIENEENLSVLTYGVSGSGKTFTILGDYMNAGLLPRAIKHIFHRYDKIVCHDPGFKLIKGVPTILDNQQIKDEEFKRKTVLKNCIDIDRSTLNHIDTQHSFQQNNSCDSTVFIWVSYVEIYNEIIADLFDDTKDECKENFSGNNCAGVGGNLKAKQLKIITNDGNVFIKNLTSIYVKNVIEALQLMTLGKSRIKYASTAINKNSSRSHCIFFIDIIKHNEPDNFLYFTYKFCDLAGSERVKKTENIGNRLKEAQRINTSLMVLNRCLDTVYNNQQKKCNDVVPIRETKLTTILQGALLGKEKMAMIVSMMPTVEFAEENLNVLNFASIARQIVHTQPQKKELSKTHRYSWFISHVKSSSPKKGQSKDITELMEANYKLQCENDRLKEAIEDKNNEMLQAEINLRRELMSEFEKHSKQKEENLEKTRIRKETLLRHQLEREINYWKAQAESLKERVRELELDVDLDADLYADLDV